MDFRGIIIEESLEDKRILKNLNIFRTQVEKVTSEHNTPWLKKWTLHSIDVKEDRAMETAERIAMAIDSKHQNSWYVDYRNSEYHFIIFKKKIFVVDLSKKEEYNDVKKYAFKLGILEEQLDFE
ncbi:hypothetical protein J4218_05105 [Candidatus Pacearchaeota archaeon]|nr:hypothetical protein [uncultured archaeon]MBS3079477.1 hypothetical protein [Candidatus Pacearchaeota archaeon]